MAVKPVLVCDICGSDGGECLSYRTVFPDGMVWEVDLCPEHQRIAEEFREKGWGREVKGRGRRQTFQVTSLEDLQKKVEQERSGRARKRP